MENVVIALAKNNKEGKSAYPETELNWHTLIKTRQTNLQLPYFRTSVLMS
jgi:hypothetical protein